MTSKLYATLLSVLLTVFAVCAAAAAWVIISPPQTYTPFGVKTLRLSIEWNKIPHEQGYEENVTYDTLSDGARDGFNITIKDNIGNEYSVPEEAKFTFSLDGNNSVSGSTPAVGTTYLAEYDIDINTIKDENGNNLEDAEWDSTVSTTGNKNVAVLRRLVKYKTVQIVTRDITDNNNWAESDWNTWYTIEDALEQATANSAANLETTVILAGKAVINGTSTEGSTVETSFSRLKDDITGYSEASRTIKSGVTLLLPVADHGNTYAFTSGTNESHQGGMDLSGDELMVGLAQSIFGLPTHIDSSGAPLETLPASYNLPTPIYSRLTIPVNLTVINNGTLTVGGISGAGQGGSTPNGHLNRISGNYSELSLQGKLESYGTLNAYGNIVGMGEINARNGLVRERFETLDWPNGQTFIGRYLGNKELNAADVLGNQVIEITDPNEFPLESYQLVAISATLNVFYGAQYVGNFRLYIGSQSKSKANLTVSTEGHFTITDITIANGFKNDINGDGVFLLREGATFRKTVNESSGRFTISITGGAVGGIATFNLNVMIATFRATTENLKFPVSNTLDIELNNGEYSFEHGYEFMKDSTLILSDSAKLTFNSSSTGIIFYEGSKLTVGEGCSLTLNGKFGGEVLGERGATLNVAADAQTTASGQIGGTGSLDFDVSYSLLPPSLDLMLNSTFTPAATGNIENLPASGLFYSGQEGQFAQNVQYRHNGTCWTMQTNPTITFNANGGAFANSADTMQPQYAQADWQGQVVYIPFADMCELPTRPYYTFVGWSTEKSTSPGDLEHIIREGMRAGVTIGEEVTYYAVWAPIEYTFNYDIFDGSTNEHKAGFLTTWTAENGQLTLSGLDLPVSKPYGYEFDGWYSDIDCTITIDIIDTSNASSVFQGGETTVTVYGKLEQQFTAAIEYDLNEMRDVPGYSELELPVGTTIESGLNVKENITTWADGCPVDTDIDLTKYFAGWKIRTANGTEEEITEGTMVSGGLCTNNDGNWTLTLVAQWADKTAVTFTDSTESFTNFTSRTYYYKPGQTVTFTGDHSLQLTAPNGEVVDIVDGTVGSIDNTLSRLQSKDYDVTVSTYYADNGGWKLNEALVSSHTVADAAPLTFTANRANKVKLTISGSNATIEITPTSKHDNIQNSYSDNELYFKIGEEITAKVNYLGDEDRSWSRDGDPIQGESTTFTMKNDTTLFATSSTSCLVEGTLITLADGTQKPVEELTAGDEVLVFNHETGKYEAGTLMMNDHDTEAATTVQVLNLAFSDRTILRIVGNHGLFDRTLQKYVFITKENVQEFIGHCFSKTELVNGEFIDEQITLESYTITEECVRIFSPISGYHLNIVAEGILTVTPVIGEENHLVNIFEYDENMKYDEEKMQADIATYGLYTFDELFEILYADEELRPYLTYEMWLTGPSAYYKVAIGKGQLTIDELIETIKYQLHYLLSHQ